MNPDPTRLLIPARFHDAMVDHCLREAPLECCGLLGGVGDRVDSCYPLRNELASETRYRADGRQLIEAVRDLRERSAEILAIYHSHPRWAAIPSKTDLSENYYGDLPRIIVSLLGQTPEVRVWRLDAESFEELGWEIVSGERGKPTPVEPNPADDYTLRSFPPPGVGPRGSHSFAGVFPTMQRTLVIFKPDCVQRRLVGSILARFEAKGLRVAALKLLQVDRSLGEKHYAEHKDRPFFGGLIDFITGGPVVVGVLEGNEAIAVVRAMLGATNGVAAAPGTVRGDFSISKQNNLIHGSDSEESARREMALWFKPEEIVGYAIAGEEWVFAGA